ncbi:MAG: transposase [Methylococcales bacterium]|nr:transposase [Methylococcales bacterium]
MRRGGITVWFEEDFLRQHWRGQSTGKRGAPLIYSDAAIQVLPMQRFKRPVLGFMTREEILAVIGQPGDTWTSQRDHLLLAMLYNTGTRVSEIIGV